MPRAAAAAARLVHAIAGPHWRGPWWFRVRGRSMLPTLQEGDAVFIRPRPPAAMPAGALVVADDPDGSGRVLVKRLGSRGPGGFAVHSDNRAEGRDSRHFGPLPPHRLRGQVVLVWTRDGALRRPPPSRS
jgi:nickel-type superoxide dismutase maturation protease